MAVLNYVLDNFIFRDGSSSSTRSRRLRPPASFSLKRFYTKRYGERLRQSHDRILQELEKEYTRKRSEKKDSLLRGGPKDGRSAGNRAHHFRLPDDADTLDCQPEMLRLCKEVFARQVSPTAGFSQQVCSC